VISQLKAMGKASSCAARSDLGLGMNIKCKSRIGWKSSSDVQRCGSEALTAAHCSIIEARCRRRLILSVSASRLSSTQLLSQSRTKTGSIFAHPSNRGVCLVIRGLNCIAHSLEAERYRPAIPTRLVALESCIQEAPLDVNFFLAHCLHGSHLRR